MKMLAWYTLAAFAEIGAGAELTPSLEQPEKPKLIKPTDKSKAGKSTVGEIRKNT